MMTAPLISVVVPVYNTAKWLRKCLDSICSQTYENLEILCVNDGSTDNSAEILAEYEAKDARIKVLNQCNAGVSVARNAATAKCHGEWVCYVDSDDYMASGILEEAVRMIAPDVDVVSFGVENVWEEGKDAPEGAERYYNLHAENLVVAASPDMAGELSHAVWGKLWRRSVISSHGVHSPQGMRYEDESFFYLFMHHARKVALCPSVGYYYLQRSSSFIHTMTSAVESVKMTLQVMRYTMESVRAEGHTPCECSWCQDMLLRMYEARYHVTPENERMECSQLAGVLAMEKGFLPRLAGDYRFRCMAQPQGWRRLFLSRYLNAEIYRLFGVPVWMVEYQDGVAIRHSCMLVSALLRKLGISRTSSGGR